MTVFRDRRDAGRRLASRLLGYARRDDVVVLGLSRGGVPVAFEIARSLGAPLDVFVVRKLGLPSHEELAMGAIAPGGVRIFNASLVKRLHVPGHVVDAVATREEVELARREWVYRGGRPFPSVRGKTVIIVDDGLATGFSMRAAVAALRRRQPARIVVAVPVAPSEMAREFAAHADEFVCVETLESFVAVGEFYERFEQLSDREVVDLLREARRISVLERKQRAV